MHREIVWGNGQVEAGRKEFTSVGNLMATALWKVIMLGYEWCHYYRDGELVKTYSAERSEASNG